MVIMVFVIGNHDGKGIMLDPTHLRSFLAVTRTRNFSAAARRLGLRWPGLSELSNQFDPRAMPGRWRGSSGMRTWKSFRGWVTRCI